MPHRSTPPEHTFPGLATRKRMAAEKREREAAKMRAEAAVLDRKWREYIAKRDGRSQAVSA
jgi:hypothetical protein